MKQEIRFCTTEDGVRLAWSSMGHGPPLVKAANWLSHLEFDQNSPIWRHWLRELSRDHTLIRYDERGCGLSDWNVTEFSVEAWVRDLEAVVKAAGLERFALLGISQGGPVAISYAVRNPERVSHLILYGTYAQGWGKRESSADLLAERDALLTLTRVGWGRDTPAYRQVFTALFVPDASEEQFHWFNELQRISASPENAVEFQRAFSQIDVTDVLDDLPVPPLILHAQDDLRVPFESGRALAARIPRSRFVALRSRNHLLLEHEPGWREFLREVRSHLGVVETEVSRERRTRVHEDFHSLLDFDRRRRVEEIFEAALDLAPTGRRAFLAARCGSDAELLTEVSALLEAHERSGILDAAGPVLPSPAPGGSRVHPPPATDRSTGWLGRARHRFFRRAGRVEGPASGPGDSPASSATRGAEGEAEVPGRVGHYDVLERIGSGGMGLVYRARDTRLDRTVALKFLPAHLSSDEKARGRFLLEAQAAAALDHPHICTIHEIGSTESGGLFIAMPCYEGESLQQKIERGPLEVAEAVELALQVARGLAKAHEVGVIHRDIKPANILLTTDGIAKIVDFGLAKLSGVNLTRTGTTMGTVAYMSPEQVGGEPVDARTDLWSLGVVLYEMLAGSRPFTGDNSIAVLHAIMKREPEPLGRRREGLAPEFERTVHRCLAKDPNERCASAAELVELLEAQHSASLRTRRPVVGADAAISPGGERRRACVVSSSITNYSELVERLSPTDLEAVNARIEEDVRRLVEQEGGVVNSCSGDQIVLLFGVPAAHEDDLRRAVSTALALHDRLGQLDVGLPETSALRPLALRTGIGTGMVVVQPSVVEERTYRVAGPAVDLAARLSAHAGPGEVIISEECRRRVAPHFTTEAGAPLTSRGRTETLVPYRVLGETRMSSPFDSAERLTAFVGRERELDALREASRRAASGEGRFVSVVGDAGTGKSRLLFEFRRRVDPDEWRVVKGRCQEGVCKDGTCGPFVDVLRDRLGLQRGSVTPVDEVVRSVLGISAELERFLPHYLDMLGLESELHPMPELEGEQRRQAVLDAIAAFLTIDAKRKPVAVLLENWEHADGISREALRQLAGLVAAHRLLIVVTARPDVSTDWGSPSFHLPILLGPLDLDSASRLMSSALDGAEVPAELASRLYHRTGGNPFFLEELCRALLERGTIRIDGGTVRPIGSVGGLELPDSVQAIIRSRLDALDTRTRLVTIHAATIGREFSEAVLRQTLEEPSHLAAAVQVLREHGLVQQVGVPPKVTYRFTHAAVQEVAYEGLLRHRQKELHEQVASAIEQVHADEIEQHSDRLAFHYGAAGVWWKAVLYGQRAAERAESVSQFADALDLLDSTLGWVERLPSEEERQEVRIRILFKQERLCETLGLRERQRQLADELVRSLQPEGATSRLAEAHLRRGDVSTLTRQFQDAERELSQALRIGRELRDRDIERNALRSIGLLRWHQERNEEAIKLQEQALDIDRELGDAEGEMIELSNLGSLYKGIGRFEEALDHLFEAVRVREGFEGEDGALLDRKLAYVLHLIGGIYRSLGDSEKAADYIDRAASHAGGSLQPIHQSYHLTSLAHLRLQEGRIEESLELYRQAISASRKANTADALAQSQRILGEVLVGLGRSSEALPHLLEAAETFGQLRDRDAEAAMWEAAARAHEVGKQTKEARAAWDRVRVLSERHHNDGPAMRAIEALARLSRDEDPEQARRHYAKAIDLARRNGDRAGEASLRNSLAILHWRRGELEPALACYREALGIYKDREDWVHAGLILNSLGVTLRGLGRVDEALAHLTEALEVNRMTGERLLEAQSLAVLGELAHEAARYEEAIERFEESLLIRREVKDRIGMGWMMYRIGRSHTSLGVISTARDYLASALEIADELDDDQLGEACRSVEV